jgi:hypothetical protein
VSPIEPAKRPSIVCSHNAKTDHLKEHTRLIKSPVILTRLLVLSIVHAVLKNLDVIVIMVLHLTKRSVISKKHKSKKELAVLGPSEKFIGGEVQMKSIVDKQCIRKIWLAFRMIILPIRYRLRSSSYKAYISLFDSVAYKLIGGVDTENGNLDHRVMPF